MSADPKGANDPFFFGAATSSHQVEGGTQNDWTEWERANAERLVRNAERRHAANPWEAHLLARHFTPLKIENYVSGAAADHYHRFREDFDIAQSLGHNAHRFSLEWSRIEPEEGRFDEREIEHYRAVIGALRERGMEPFVTLWHFTLPVWMAAKGGTLAKDFPECLARYAAVVARAFKNDVRFWMTVNEPEIYSSKAHYKGDWPPQGRSFFAMLESGRQCARAHIAAYRAIKKENPAARVGAATDLIYFDAQRGFVSHFLKFIAERLWNTYFLRRAYRRMDFIGINYYFHNQIHNWFDKNQNEWLSDFGWEIYPEGLYHVVRAIGKYGLPIYITENGVADASDRHRERFLREHLHWLRKAVDEGADVRGYFHWSLLDNFEWDSGFWPCFGLVEVDYKTQARKIRPSALAYKELIEQWQRGTGEKK